MEQSVSTKSKANYAQAPRKDDTERTSESTIGQDMKVVTNQAIVIVGSLISSYRLCL